VDLVDSLRRQFVYDAWANNELLAALRATSADERSLQLMAHILSAEQLWLERIRQQPQSSVVWPKWGMDQCQGQSAELEKLWHAYFGEINADDLSQPVSYKNTQGEVWTSTVGDILTHVVIHSAYHRGQIASHMRETGHTPVCSDFIHGVRQGLVK
jgi:uncharacterized damage-inducible protein DinB